MTNRFGVPGTNILREDVLKQNLPVSVFEGNILDPELPAPQGHYHLVLLAEVVASHFRDTQQVRALFEAADRLLVPGGILLFSAFIALDGYKPDETVKAMSQVMWCCIFSRREIQDAHFAPEQSNLRREFGSLPRFKMATILAIPWSYVRPLTSRKPER